MIPELRVPLSGTSLAQVGALAASKAIEAYAHATFIELRRGEKSIRVSLAHAIYLYDVINNFDYYFDAVAPIAFEDALLVDYSTGRFHEVKDFDLMPVFFPSFAEPIATTRQYLDWSRLSEGDVVLDLGAYSGLSAIVFDQAVGRTGRVACLEPDRRNYDATSRNLRLYGQLTGRRIEVLNGAAWSHCEGLEFSCEGNMGASATAIVGGRGEVHRVASLTLSEVVARLDLRKLDFIKIDIEGAEETVLASSIDVLRTFRPRIVIEPHMVAGRMSTEPCEAQLARAGYRSERIVQNGGIYMTGSSIPLLLATPA